MQTSGDATGEQLSNAIVCYLGHGTRAWPDRSRERAAYCDPNVDDAVIDRAADLVSRVVGTTPHHEPRTIAELGDLIELQVRREHPQLTDAAVDALVWAWTFEWR